MARNGSRFLFWFVSKGPVSFTPPVPPPFGGNLVWPPMRMLNWPGDDHIGWPGL